MTQAEYLKAWKAEIEVGVTARKLRMEAKKADLRIVAASLDEQEEAGK